MNAHVALLRPLGAPQGVPPQEWRKAVKERISALLETATALIDALDRTETDCDLEDGADGEPRLSWTERGPCSYGDNSGDDRERDDSDDEDSGDAEPSLGAPERGGWYVSQEHWADGARGDHEREEDHDREDCTI